MTRQLDVWLFGKQIGTLSQIDGRLNFSYVIDWLNTRNAIPLSQKLSQFLRQKVMVTASWKKFWR